MARYHRPVLNRLLCLYQTLSAVAAVEAAVAAAVAAAQQQQLEQYAAAVHICRKRHISRGVEQGADRGVSSPTYGPVLSLAMPCRPGI